MPTLVEIGSLFRWQLMYRAGRQRNCIGMHWGDYLMMERSLCTDIGRTQELQQSQFHSVYLCTERGVARSFSEWSAQAKRFWCLIAGRFCEPLRGYILINLVPLRPRVIRYIGDIIKRASSFFFFFTVLVGNIEVTSREVLQGERCNSML